MTQVREWIARNLGPLGQIEGVLHGAGDLGKVLAGLPAIATRSVTVLNQFDQMTRDGLVLAPETVAAIGKAEAKRNRWQTAALWAAALWAAAPWVVALLWFAGL